MARLSFLLGADADYQEGLAWYRSKSPRAAAGFEAAVEVALRRIADAPELWPPCDERHRFYVLRRYPYSIIYRIESGDVLVVAVAQSGRSASYWHGRG
jgi:plasmid stabilization system protein ParE